jgi:hypothetical protein
MDRRSELLTFLASLKVLGCILLHVRPPIALPYGPVSQRSSSGVPSIHSFVNLSQQVLEGIRVNITEVGLGVGPTVEMPFF